jgi:hypothetical protein
MNIKLINQRLLNGINVKIWLGITIAALISAFLVLPYSLQLTGIPTPSPSQLVINIPIGFLQFAIYVFIGLKISRKIEIEPTPVLSGKTKLEKYHKLSVVSGVIVGLIIMALSKLVFPVSILPVKEGVSLEAHTPGPLFGFLASFYGGIAEEVFLRLLVVPLLCLLIIGVLKLLRIIQTWKVSDRVAWISIILAAILFGLGHLPATAAIMDITAIVILRAILLNGIGGIVFGWLFYRKGLEHAMVSHFSADIVLHALLPLLGFTL